MQQRRHLATLTVHATVSARISAIAHQAGRLVLISSLIGSGFSLYPFRPAMAQTDTAQTNTAQTNTARTVTAQAGDEAEDSAEPTPATDSSTSESADEATTESSESSDSAPATDRRSPLSTARPNLRVGSEGQAVAELQALLKLLGYYTGAVDGLYSEDTASAVSEFQSAAGLASDGVVGPATWGQLLPAAPVASPTSSADQTTPAIAVAVTDFPTPVLSPGELASGTAAATETDEVPADSPVDSGASPGASPTPTTAADAVDANATAETPAAEAADATTETEPTATASLPADGSDPSAYPILRLGASGSAVERLQERLRSLGHYQGTVDGIFGERTQEAVRAAQQRNQLTVDGIVGPATWDVLLD